MKKIIIFFCIFIFGYSQTLRKAPKQIGLSLNYERRLNTTYDSLFANGYGASLEYGWQLSGFNGGRRSYLFVPIGYSYFKNNSSLWYGWKVQHNILKKGKFIPFIGYALYLRQIKINKFPGKVYGHQTTSFLGINYLLSEKIVVKFNVYLARAKYYKLSNSTPNKETLIGTALIIAIRR